MSVEAMRHAHPSFLMLDLSAPTPRWVEMIGPGMPSGRVGTAAVVVGAKLYVFGGYGPGAEGALENFRNAFVRDLDAKLPEWRCLRDLPIAVRWMSAVSLDSRYIVLVGGYAETPVTGFLSETFLYDTEADKYLPAGSIPLAIATAAMSIDGEGTIYLAGGEDAMRHRSAAFLIGKTPGQ